FTPHPPPVLSPLSLHDALPIFAGLGMEALASFAATPYQHLGLATGLDSVSGNSWAIFSTGGATDTLFARVDAAGVTQDEEGVGGDRKSTRLNSSHLVISYAVFC